MHSVRHGPVGGSATLGEFWDLREYCTVLHEMLNEYRENFEQAKAAAPPDSSYVQQRLALQQARMQQLEDYLGSHGELLATAREHQDKSPAELAEALKRTLRSIVLQGRVDPGTDPLLRAVATNNVQLVQALARTGVRPADPQALAQLVASANIHPHVLQSLHDHRLLP